MIEEDEYETIDISSFGDPTKMYARIRKSSATIPPPPFSVETPNWPYGTIIKRPDGRRAMYVGRTSAGWHTAIDIGEITTEFGDRVKIAHHQINAWKPA